MKELIIHIGYPKTATTSLQNNLFVNLHNRGFFNYLGRADLTPAFFEKHRNVAKEIREALFNERPYSLKTLEASHNRYLLSEETFTIPAYYNFLAFQLDYSVYELPKKLKEIFIEGIDQFKILITLRNQADLLESLYAQRYDRFHNSEEHSDPNTHFFRGSNFKSELFEEMEFVRIIQAYSDEFGKDNIYLTFYEDLKNNEEEYFDILSELYQCDKKIINESLNNSPLNIKKRKGDKKVRVLKNRSVFYSKCKELANKIGMADVGKYIPISIKKRSFREKELVVPPLLPHLKKQIRAHYKDINEELVDWGVSRKKLSKYKYI